VDDVVKVWLNDEVVIKEDVYRRVVINQYCSQGKEKISDVFLQPILFLEYCGNYSP